MLYFKGTIKGMQCVLVKMRIKYIQGVSEYWMTKISSKKKHIVFSTAKLNKFLMKYNEKQAKKKYMKGKN